MKIFIFKFKKKFFIFAALILIIILYIIFSHNNADSIAIKLSADSILGKDIKEKISNNLTTNDDRIAYLTFDDGPTLKATGKILDILKEENIKASFFVIGKYVAKHPELVKRAYDEGHYIANHGYTHNNSKLYESNESFISEIKNTDIEIGKAIGVPDYCARVFRFPNGFMSSNYKARKKISAKLLEDMGYTYVDWNCLNRDSERKYSRTQLLNNLKKTSKNKGTLIVLMHDTSDVNDTPSILKDSILYLKSQGYEFQNFYSLLE